MAARIAASQGTLAQDQWRVLLEGTRGMAETAKPATNPAASWLSEAAWQDLFNLSAMPAFEVSCQWNWGAPGWPSVLLPS